MRIAVIDCGTNTFNLLIVDTISGTKYNRIHNTRTSVKLGESGINEGFIANSAFERGLDALINFSTIVKKYNVEKVLTLATSAIRDAANRKDFVEEVFFRAGIEMNVIDGNKEAELIYLGCREALPLSENTSLIMDIGGGSTEFILSNKNEILWKHSFNLGAARLLEKFNPSSPINDSEIKNIEAYLLSNMNLVIEAVKKFPPYELIGSSGAFDSIVEMINGELNGEALVAEKTGYQISLDNYHQISKLVKDTTLDDRKKIKGLTPMRFDMIVISCLLIDFTLNKMNIDKMRVSTFSLKEGALMEFIKSN